VNRNADSEFDLRVGIFYTLLGLTLTIKVSGLLGHSQVSTTLDIYTHAFDDKKKAASAVLQESLGI